MDKKIWEIVGNGKPTGSVLKETICSFRHDINKRAKLTQPNPSPSSFIRQNEMREMRREPEVPEGKKPKWENGSIALQGLP